MGRYNYSNRAEADSLRKIEVSFLKKHGYFIGWKSGVITWSSSWSSVKNSVSIEVSTTDNYLRIYYTQTNSDSKDKKSFDYKVRLTTTPCNYGGSRYWFLCPCYKNGFYCGRRVGALYKNGDYFGCRHCYNLTYSSRKLSGIAKRFGNISAIDVEKAKERVKTMYYNGKPTRKYISFLKAEEKLESALIGMYLQLDKDVTKLKS